MLVYNEWQWRRIVYLHVWGTYYCTYTIDILYTEVSVQFAGLLLISFIPILAHKHSGSLTTPSFASHPFSKTAAKTRGTAMAVPFNVYGYPKALPPVLPIFPFFPFPFPFTPVIGVVVVVVEVVISPAAKPVVEADTRVISLRV